VTLGAQRERGEDGKRLKVDPAQKRKGGGIEGGRGAAGPVEIAKQIERAIDSALIHLAPGTTTSVKVGRSGMTAEQVSQNIEAVVAGLVEKFITKGWRNIRSIHIKGPETIALPVWLTNELWVEDEDVHEQKKMFGKKPRPLIDGVPSADAVKQITNGSDGAANKKRKAETATKVEGDDKHAKKKIKQEQLAAELALRKEKLKKQKEAVMSKATEV
jgi:ribosome biogenesis protein UTP30